MPYPLPFHHQIQFANPTLPHCQPQPYIHPIFNPFSTHLPYPSLQHALPIFSHPGTSLPPEAHPILPEPPTFPTHPYLTHPQPMTAMSPVPFVALSDPSPL